MKILIDIGHPAHVHYFRNFIKIMQARGHQFLVIARQREVISTLLKYYDIQYIDRGKGRDSYLGKLSYMLFADGLIYLHASRFKPDIFLSFSSPYAAQVSSMMHKPHIILNDTEHSDKAHRSFTYPFTNTIITPASYQNNLGIKQIKINSVIESLYLHNSLYTPDASIYNLLGLAYGTPYVIVRFVAWQAYHDYGEHGIDLKLKKAIIAMLEPKYKVFISSEREPDSDLTKYQINIPPERMHDALAFASIFVGESATMASESTLFGNHAVYINSLPLMCYLKLEQENGLLKHFSTGEGVLSYIKSLMDIPHLKKDMEVRRNNMIQNFINPTDFLVWFVENYPQSEKIMRNTPDYQYNFK